MTLTAADTARSPWSASDFPLLPTEEHAMFERFTEKARRVIFFSRYEASRFGSHFIETEHILLGILRENGALADRLFGSAALETSPSPPTELPAELVQSRQHLQVIVKSIEAAIFAHEFRKARNYSEEEQKERENLRLLYHKYNLPDSSDTANRVAAEIRRRIESLGLPQEEIAVSIDLPLSPQSKRVLAYSAEEAERLKHKHVGLEHLVLGLLREEASVGAQILREHGISAADVRAKIALEK